TFGASQREEAERWLRTYAPAELAFDAWTHESLLGALDPGWAPPPPPDEAVALLAEALGGELPRLGAWRNHLPALHAELRAHYWGRARPIAFRGRGASTDAASRERSYRERRTEALGQAAADAVLRAAAAIPEEIGQRLFGDLERAARIAD